MTSREALSKNQEYSWLSFIQQNAVAQDSVILLMQNLTKILISALPKLKLCFQYATTLKTSLRLLHDHLSFTSKLNRAFKVFGYFHAAASVADNWRTDTTYSLLKFISLWSYGIFALVDSVSLVSTLQFRTRLKISQLQRAASGALIAGATFGLCSSIRRVLYLSNLPAIFSGHHMTAQAGRYSRKLKLSFVNLVIDICSFITASSGYRNVAFDALVIGVAGCISSALKLYLEKATANGV